MNDKYDELSTICRTFWFFEAILTTFAATFLKSSGFRLILKIFDHTDKINSFIDHDLNSQFSIPVKMT